MKALMNDVLLQSVGESVMSKEGEPIGNIVEVKRNSGTNFIDYMILECECFPNEETRFFAIPASRRFITISDTFTILFQFPKKDLFFARKIQTNRCPDPNLKYGKSIFELYNYSPAGKQTIHHSTRPKLQEA
jgi:hypothetical protein